MSAHIGLATAAAEPELDAEGQLLRSAIEKQGARCSPVVWTDPAIDYRDFDSVIVRSTWDYPRDLAAFRGWIRGVSEKTRLHNPAELIEWNLDKRYLEYLADEGIPTVPSAFIEPGEPLDHPWLDGEHVVKPTVSAGSKDTLRLQAHESKRSRDHLRAIHRSGRTALVQPYLAEVDEVGETGMIFIEGVFSHAIGKAAILERGAEVIEGLFAPEEITRREAEPYEIRVGEQVLTVLSQSLPGQVLQGRPPLYARIDVLPTSDGPRLLELELIEPSLFLEHWPERLPAVAAAFAAR